MDTHSIWDNMAQQYDTEDRVNIAKIIVQAVRSELKDTNGKTALDYGCGTGLVGFGLTDLFASMLFVDASEQMIEHVNRKIRAEHISGVSTLCCDFLKKRLVICSLIMLSSLRFCCILKNSRLILDRLYSLLKKDGHLIIVDFDKNEAISSDLVHNGFNQEELKGLLLDMALLLLLGIPFTMVRKSS